MKLISHVAPPGLTRKSYKQLRTALSKPLEQLTEDDWTALHRGMRLMMAGLENWYYKYGGGRDESS